MNKYKIEGNLNFYDELFKSLDKVEEFDNNCLISNEPLIDKYVTLNCGHKFNYVPLYNDILNHKKKFNKFERSKNLLGKKEIRCPYCRSVHPNVLPYYSDLKCKKVDGVNDIVTYVFNSSYNSNKIKKCEATMELNKNFNFQIPESSTNLKFIKIDKCLKIGKPNNILSKFNDDKNYCVKHKDAMYEYYKDKAKKAKLLEKQKAKESKLLEKQKAKESKLLEKQKAKETNAIKNEVISDLNLHINKNESSNIITCKHILKTGKNKGNNCQNKIYSNGLCKKHNISIANNILDNNLNI
jgi:hypothetical protein